jgi:hypothetical protein
MEAGRRYVGGRKRKRERNRGRKEADVKRSKQERKVVERGLDWRQEGSSERGRTCPGEQEQERKEGVKGGEEEGRRKESKEE